jgi:serine protease Do
MDQNKPRRILGVITLTTFLLIFISVSGGYSSIGREAQELFRALEERLSGNRGGNGGRTLVRQQLVSEESAVIDVVDSVSPSVVSIIVRTVDFDIFSGPLATESGIGTGFIVDPSGLIVTNSHVVDNRDGLYSVVLKDGTTYEVEEIHLDEMTDLAIIEVSARNLPVVELGDSDSIKVGQQAIAIGNALGRFSNTVTVGVVSGIARELTATSSFGSNPKTYEGAIQTDAALNPGNSGGPLLNSVGQVVGINVATTRGADNIGFAIPVNTLKPILDTFMAEGRIIRPYLGVSYTMITREIAAIRRIPEGAYISRVLADSPALKAGMVRGDVIISFNGKELSGTESLSSMIGSKKVGERVEVLIDRNGERRNLTVTLEAAPERL